MVYELMFVADWLVIVVINICSLLLDFTVGFI